MDHIEQTSIIGAAIDTKWPDVMEKKITAYKNNSWDFVLLPNGKKAIGCKWVYKSRRMQMDLLKGIKPDWLLRVWHISMVLSKCQLYIRCLISLAASKNSKLFQLYINNAFLHGNLDEQVFIKVHEGVNATAGHVCKITKSLHGLKQTSRQWFVRLLDELKSQGYKQ